MQSTGQAFHLRFENCDVADANVLAEELRRELLDEVDDIQVDVRRDDPSAQDFGSTLVLVLGTPAVIALAKALGNWLTRKNAVSVSILTPDRRVIVQNVDSADAVKIVQAALSRELRP